MSLDATVWAWKQRIKQNSKARRSAVKIVLLSLADRAGEEHTCYPSIARLELDTELNRKTIINAIKHLEEIGLIRDTGERKGKSRQVKVYKLVGVKGREDVVHKNSTENGTVNNNSPENGTIAPLPDPLKPNSPENGTVPNLPDNSPENGTPEQSRKRDSELPITEPVNKPSCASDSGSAGEEPEVWMSEKGKALNKSQQHVFSILWDEYGFKHSRARAIDEFLKVIWPFFGKDREANKRNLDFFLAAIRKSVESRKTDSDCTPLYFERWIKRRRWEDEFAKDTRMSSGMVSNRNRGESTRPHWEVSGFESFEHFEKFTEVRSALQTLAGLKKPSIREQQRMEELREKLKGLAPAKREEECVA